MRMRKASALMGKVSYVQHGRADDAGHDRHFYFTLEAVAKWEN